MSFLAAWIGMRYLPSIIPTHFDLHNKPDEYGPKTQEYVLAVIFSICGLILLLVSTLIQRFVDPKEKEKAEYNVILVNHVGIGMMCLFLVMQITDMRNAYQIVNGGNTIPALKITNIALCLLLIYIGMIVIKSDRNKIFGARTSWILQNDENWQKGQKKIGKAFIESSIVWLIIFLFVNESKQMIVLLIMCVVMIIWIVIAAVAGCHK